MEEKPGHVPLLPDECLHHRVSEHSAYSIFCPWASALGLWPHSQNVLQDLGLAVVSADAVEDTGPKLDLDLSCCAPGQQGVQNHFYGEMTIGDGEQAFEEWHAFRLFMAYWITETDTTANYLLC